MRVNTHIAKKRNMAYKIKMPTKRNTAYLNITMKHEILKRLDKWREEQPVPPPRSQVIARSVKVFLDMVEAEKRPVKKGKPQTGQSPEKGD